MEWRLSGQKGNTQLASHSRERTAAAAAGSITASAAAEVR